MDIPMYMPAVQDLCIRSWLGDVYHFECFFYVLFMSNQDDVGPIILRISRMPIELEVIITYRGLTPNNDVILLTFSLYIKVIDFPSLEQSQNKLRVCMYIFHRD